MILFHLQKSYFYQPQEFICIIKIDGLKGTQEVFTSLDQTCISTQSCKLIFPRKNMRNNGLKVAIKVPNDRMDLTEYPKQTDRWYPHVGQSSNQMKHLKRRYQITAEIWIFKHYAYYYEQQTLQPSSWIQEGMLSVSFLLNTMVKGVKIWCLRNVNLPHKRCTYLCSKNFMYAKAQ